MLQTNIVKRFIINYILKKISLQKNLAVFIFIL